VLIDADNAQASVIEGLLAEIARFGEATVKTGKLTAPQRAEPNLIAETETVKALPGEAPVKSVAQEKCDECGRDVPGHDVIHYGSPERGYKDLCSACFNADVAKSMDLEGFAAACKQR